jgi:hypothetical protein
MSLPALDDIVAHTGSSEPIDGVVRIETAPLEKTAPLFLAKMRSVYPHDEIFGQYCTVNNYIDCPPDELFGYLADTRSLEEWTYTPRDFTATEKPGLWLAYDRSPLQRPFHHPRLDELIPCSAHSDSVIGSC